MKRNHDQRQQGVSGRPVDRRGAVLLVALICTLVAVMLFGTLLKIAVTGHGQLRNEERRVQADWLAEAGVERAAALLESNPDYAGETWQIAPQEFGGRFSGTVRIVVETNPNQPEHRVVSVQSHYPAGMEQSFQSRKRVAITVSQVSKSAEAP